MAQEEFHKTISTLFYNRESPRLVSRRQLKEMLIKANRWNGDIEFLKNWKLLKERITNQETAEFELSILNDLMYINETPFTEYDWDYSLLKIE